MDHPTDRPKRVKKQDRTGTWISFGLHVGVIVISLIILANTKMGKDLIKDMLGATRDQKKPEDRPKPPPAPPRTGQRRAPVDAPPPSGGQRKAADAPPPVGEGFFTEMKEKKTSGSSGGDGKTNVAVKVVGPVVKVTPPKLFASAPAKSDIRQLYIERAKEAASVEAFGSEQISKTGVSDAGAIIKNVSGATIVDGKFAVIRGLSDRYVTTTLNGGEVPSPDPYRRSAPLDLFPAQIIDKVVVTKTFTPDQQGSYTGGGIDIVTKSFPEKSFVNFSIGGSYNPQASLNDKFLTYDGGKHDWAGMDDGTRALPGDLADPSVTLPNRPFSAPRPNTPANIALRQQRFADADRLQDLTRQMGTTQFAAVEEGSLLNHGFSLSAGDTTHLFGLPLGVFGSTSYRRDFAFYDDGVSSRYGSDGLGNAELDNSYKDAKSTETVNWSGMVNLAYQLREGHELGFVFLYNQNSEKISQQQVGTIEDDQGPTYFRNRLIWTEKNLQTYQLKGSHVLPEVGDIKLDWLAALAHVTQIEPDLRFFNFAQEGGSSDVGRNNTPDPKQPTRYSRDLDENNRNEKIDLTVPFRNWNEDEGKFKVGVFESFSKRTFSDRAISYSGDDPFNGNPNQYLTPSNLGYTTTTNASGSVNFNWHRYLDQIRDSTYDGESGIRAGYLMLDIPLVPSLRFVGGVRYETTDISVHSESDIPSSVTSLTTNDSKISQADLLPAAGLIWSIQPDMNLRAHFSQTVARPSFRELAAYRSYDPVLDDLLDGNPNLLMTSIDNYDLRWEWFFKPGEIVSVSLFYKDLKNAIERRYLDIQGNSITFGNQKEATVYGVEFEARKNLGFIDPILDVFSVGGNVSLIGSETRLTDADFAAKSQLVKGAKQTRQLYDQSPYIVNLDLNFDNPSSGTSASLIFNIAGPRIAIASLNTEDVFEQPAPGLDFILAQKLGRHLTAKFAAKNLLNPKIERTYGENSNLIYSSYRKGMSFGVAFSYDF